MEVQTSFTMWRQAGWRAQKFSKRKRLDLGIWEETWTTRGTWSEENLVRKDRVEFRKAESQARFMNALSNLSRVGICRLLDQVKDLSSRGSSMSCRSEMVSLKRLASEAWKLSLFFSLANRMRLKSPMTNHGTESDGWISASSWRKEGLRCR